MNERIKELWEEAHEQMPIIVLDPETCKPYHKIGNGGKPMYYRGLNAEKFAQLIVRECIDTAFHHGHPDLEFLLKHFGVE